MAKWEKKTDNQWETLISISASGWPYVAVNGGRAFF